MIVGGEVKEKRVVSKLRRPPHRNLGAHDLFDVAHECRALAAFRSKRVDYDVILLAVDCESVLRPVGRDLGRSIDQYVPVRKLPFSLAGLIDPAVHNLPASGRMNREFHWIRFVTNDVHEDRAAVVVCVALVELRERSGEIVCENLVGNGQPGASRRSDAPCLPVNTRYWKRGFVGAGRGGRATAINGAKLLHVLGKVEDGVTARRALGHLKLKWFVDPFRRQLDLDQHFEEMRRWARHPESIVNRFERWFLGGDGAAGKKN